MPVRILLNGLLDRGVRLLALSDVYLPGVSFVSCFRAIVLAKNVWPDQTVCILDFVCVLFERVCPTNKTGAQQGGSKVGPKWIQNRDQVKFANRQYSKS